MPLINNGFPAAAQSVCAPVSFTVVSSDALMTKTISLNASGRPEKTIPPPLASGEAQRATLEGDATAQLEMFRCELIGLKPHEGIICAPPPHGREIWKLVSKKKLAANPGAIARTDENFQPQSGPALLGLDFDTADFPADFREKIAKAGGWHAVLKSACKAFDGAAMLTRASVSSGLTINGGPPDDRGLHCYFIASDGRAAPDFVRTLADRLMLGGFMWAKLTKTGLVVPCTLFDVAASGDASRLWYEADGILSGEGLAYAPDARTPQVHPGGVLDVKSLAPLSEVERAALDEMRAALVRKMEPEAAPLREAFTKRRKAGLVAKGIAPEVAERIVSGAIDRQELASDCDILLDEGGAVTVRDILANPEQFHGKTCADPLEPEYGGGRNLAKIYTDKPPFHIFSHAHGGIDYKLAPDPADFFDVIEPAPDSLPEPKVQAAGEWPEPADIFGNDIPSNLSDPPPGSLPATIAAWVEDESRRKGVSRAFAAGAAVCVAAGSIGNTLRIRPRMNDTGWEEPACLWVTLVDSPGRGKSPILRAALAPASEIDSKWARDAAPKIAAWEAEKRRAKRTDILPPPPPFKRLTVDNVTSEKLLGLLKDNPRGLIQAPDELAQLLGGLGQYKASGNADRATLLKLNSGGAVTVDRVGGGTLRAETALMSILAGTQPDKIEKIAAELGSDGLLQRFIFICGDGVERGGGEDVAPDQMGARGYHDLICCLATSGNIKSPAVRLSPGASAALNATADKIRALRNLPGASSAWQGHVEKWAGFLPRIMLTFHAIEQWEVFGEVDPARPVDESTARKACEFARFLVRHSLAFYQKTFARPDDAAEAVWLAGHILTHQDKTAFTRRDVSNARKALRSNDRTLLAMMGELENCGWVRVLERGADGPAKWAVNARVHQEFQERAEYEQAERQRKQAAIKNGADARKNWLETDTLSEVGKK